MSEFDVGGPAFPVVTGERQIGAYEKEFDAAPGMSLRDWFAGQALAGIRASGSEASHAHDAADAYLAAEAMLRARRGGLTP